MDFKNYIETGILEQYARNELDQTAVDAVDELLATHLELGEELEHIYIRLEKMNLI